MMKLSRCQLFFVLSLTSFVLYSSALRVVPAPEYTMSCPDNLPLGELTVNGPDPYHIFSIFPSSLREVQIKIEDLHNFNDSDAFIRTVKDGYLVSHYDSSSSEFTSYLKDMPNKLGYRFNATLPNGANISYSFDINLESVGTTEIPRPATDFDCEYANTHHEANCNCSASLSMPINSIEFTLDVNDWPFEELKENYTDTILILTLDLIGSFDISYFLSLAPSELVDRSMCDVGTVDLHMKDSHNNDLRIPVSYFTNANTDDIVTPVETMFDKKSITIDSQGRIVFPFEFVFVKFSKSLHYDPDFSIIFGNKGDNHDDYDSGSDVDDDLKIILFSVLIPIGVIVVVSVVIVAIIIGIVRLRRNPKGPRAIQI